MFRRQILAQLRKANPGVPEKVLGLLADKLVAKVTAEDQIEGAIDELVDSMPFTVKEFSDFVQKEGDRRVTEATAKKPVTTKTGDDAPAGGDEPEPTTEVGQLKKMIGDLTQVVTGLVKEKTTSSIKSKMEAQLAEKKIPAFLLKGRVPEKEEDMEAILTEIEEDWASHGQAVSTTKLNSFKKPVVVASGSPVGDEDAVDPAIADYTKRKLAAVEQAK